jgi:hypothetical protein
MKTPVSMVVAFFLLIFNPAFAQGDEGQIKQRLESLRGLPGVMVSGPRIDPRLEQAGLAPEAVRQDVEQRLRLADVPMLGKEEGATQSAQPHIMVVVFAHAANPSFFAYTIMMQLKQNVRLESGMEMPVPTWQIASIGMVGSSDLQPLRENLRGLVDRLVADWRSVNPK